MPKPLRVVLLVAGGVQILLFGWAIYAATLGVGAIVWAGLGFGIIGIVTALFGGLLGLGRFGQGPAMGALCVAGAAMTCGVLGWLDLRSNLTTVPELARLLRPWLGAVAATAAAQGGVAALTVLVRRALSWKYLISGAVTLGVCGAILLAVRGPGASLLTKWEGAGEAFRVTVLLALSFVVLALLSAGGHLVIRAFEVTREKPEAPAKPAAA